MALINITIERGAVERLVRAVEGIRDTIDRYLFPPVPKIVASKPREADALSEFDPEAEWKREKENERRAELGQEPLP